MYTCFSVEPDQIWLQLLGVYDTARKAHPTVPTVETPAQQVPGGQIKESNLGSGPATEREPLFIQFHCCVNIMHPRSSFWNVTSGQPALCSLLPQGLSSRGKCLSTLSSLASWSSAIEE